MVNRLSWSNRSTRIVKASLLSGDENNGSRLHSVSFATAKSRVEGEEKTQTSKGPGGAEEPIAGGADPMEAEAGLGSQRRLAAIESTVHTSYACLKDGIHSPGEYKV